MQGDAHADDHPPTSAHRELHSRPARKKPSRAEKSEARDSGHQTHGIAVPKHLLMPSSM